MIEQTVMQWINSYGYFGLFLLLVLGIVGLPIPDEWADVVISNGVLNLMPDKSSGLREMARVLKPGGRLQIGDIIVQQAVPEDAKRDIDLWTG